MVQNGTLLSKQKTKRQGLRAVHGKKKGSVLAYARIGADAYVFYIRTYKDR